jgi:hypothetical protein
VSYHARLRNWPPLPAVGRVAPDDLLELARWLRQRGFHTSAPVRRGESCRFRRQLAYGPMVALCSDGVVRVSGGREARHMALRWMERARQAGFVIGEAETR